MNATNRNSTTLQITEIKLQGVPAAQLLQITPKETGSGHRPLSVQGEVFAELLAEYKPCSAARFKEQVAEFREKPAHLQKYVGNLSPAEYLIQLVQLNDSPETDIVLLPDLRVHKAKLRRLVLLPGSTTILVVVGPPHKAASRKSKPPTPRRTGIAEMAIRKKPSSR